MEVGALEVREVVPRVGPEDEGPGPLSHLGRHVPPQVLVGQRPTLLNAAQGAPSQALRVVPRPLLREAHGRVGQVRAAEKRPAPLIPATPFALTVAGRPVGAAQVAPAVGVAAARGAPTDAGPPPVGAAATAAPLARRGPVAGVGRLARRPVVRTVRTAAETARATVPLALDARPTVVNATRRLAPPAGPRPRPRVTTVATGAGDAVFGVAVGPMVTLGHLPPDLGTVVFAH